MVEHACKTTKILDKRADELIDFVALDVCDKLDAEFPGFDCCGITSNFLGLLTRVLTSMLKGQDPTDPRITGFSRVTLPALLADAPKAKAEPLREVDPIFTV